MLNWSSSYLLRGVSTSQTFPASAAASLQACELFLKVRYSVFARLKYRTQSPTQGGLKLAFAKSTHKIKTQEPAKQTSYPASQLLKMSPAPSTSSLSFYHAPQTSLVELLLPSSSFKETNDPSSFVHQLRLPGNSGSQARKNATAQQNPMLQLSNTLQEVLDILDDEDF